MPCFDEGFWNMAAGRIFLFKNAVIALLVKICTTSTTLKDFVCFSLTLPIKMLILNLLTVYHLRSQGYSDWVCGHKIGRGDFIFCSDFCSAGAVGSKENREIPLSAVTKQMGRDC